MGLSTRRAGAVLGVSHAAVHRARLSQIPLKTGGEKVNECVPNQPLAE
jgi:hypothetical protein